MRQVLMIVSVINVLLMCTHIQGGVIVINIEWYCNLDYSIESCLPRYSFSRLDKQHAKIAKGSNFRLLAHFMCVYYLQSLPRVGPHATHPYPITSLLLLYLLLSFTFFPFLLALSVFLLFHSFPFYRYRNSLTLFPGRLS